MRRSDVPDTVPSIDALPVRSLAGDGFGGRDLRVTDSLDAAIAERGADDRLVYDMKTLAFVACGRGDTLAQTPARLDPRRAWAIDYIVRACAGYDEKKYTPFRRGSGTDMAFAREMGSQAADALAWDDLRTAETSIQLSPAGYHLLRSGTFPANIPKGLEEGQRMEAFELAVMPIRCRAINACGHQSLLTAWICLQGCAPGVTLEQAMRNRLSPATVAAAMEMRRGVVRLRSQRN